MKAGESSQIRDRWRVGSKNAMFGMGTHFKAAALGSGGACKRGRGKKDGSIIYIFLQERSEKSCKRGGGLMQAVGRASTETLHKTGKIPWTGPGETLVPLNSRVLLTDFALFFGGLFLSASQVKLK